MTRAPQKTTYHLRAEKVAVEAREALLRVKDALNDRYEDGQPLSLDELRLKAGTALTWLQKAENAFADLRMNLQREYDHRTNECDPAVIERHKFEAQLKEAGRGKRKRRRDEEIAPLIQRLHAEGVVVAAIADKVGVSDFTVKRILKKEQAA